MSCFKALADKPQTANRKTDIPPTNIPHTANHKTDTPQTDTPQTATEVHVVRWPVNKEAPFNFDIPEEVHIYNRPDYNNNELLELVTEINPDKIICSGWIDKGYLKVCKHYKNKIPTVLTLDNHWFGNPKQQLARVIAPFHIKRHFSHAWVPGEPQAKYARKLGFGNKIFTGFYSADTDHFKEIYQVKSQASNIPPRFIYIGRYIPQKGLDLLFKAFIEIHEEHTSDWELWCLGTGELFDERPNHPKIKHHGFVQPADMNKYLKESGVFVLPSRFEPWGVVVHEMAVAGFPMICSSAIGGTTQFLKDDENGFLFENENKEELKQALWKIMNLNQNRLKQMSIKSHQLGMQHTPEKWADIVISI
ncbi:glycosyltransferase [Marinilabiliaceae bacterium JC017]|nr:glycosyltransferase [Marinilabiliaceae bacterium JC017]